MFLKRSRISLACAVIAFAVGVGTTMGAFAQASRPRYSSRQNGSRNVTVPQDTVISMRMDSNLSSRTSRVGDRFSATVTIPVYVDGRTIIPAGSTVEGRVTQVTPAKRMSKSGTIAIDFDELVFPNGSRVKLVGNLTSADPATRDTIDDESTVSGDTDNRSAVFVGGGGIVGAVLGGIAGGGKGAVLGGVFGAGAGVAGVLLSKGEEAKVPSGTPFGIHLRQPLTLSESFSQEGGEISRDARDPDAEPAPADDRDYRSRPDPAPSVREDSPVSEPPDVDDNSDTAEPAPADPSLPLSSPEMVRRAQAALKAQGYYEGQVDGVMSARTSTALRNYQRENKLQETGDLDPETAKSLGLYAAATNSSRRSEPTPVSNRTPTSNRTPASAVVLANVLSATASRSADGSIQVLINTQANTGGWRWFGEKVINGDTLEVYARAERPTGIVTQALTRGRIELTVADGVEYVRSVVVHGAGGDVNIPLTAAGRTSPSSGNSSRGNPSGAMSLQRQAEEVLAEYQRNLGVRITGTGVELDSRAQYQEPEIELLFALDNFANAAQLYARLLTGLQDPEGVRGATLALAREARRADRLVTTVSGRAAQSITVRWDAVRQDVLRLMRAQNIDSSEIDN